MWRSCERRTATRLDIIHGSVRALSVACRRHAAMSAVIKSGRFVRRFGNLSCSHAMSSMIRSSPLLGAAHRDTPEKGRKSQLRVAAGNSGRRRCAAVLSHGAVSATDVRRAYGQEIGQPPSVVLIRPATGRSRCRPTPRALQGVGRSASTIPQWQGYARGLFGLSSIAAE